MLLRRRRQPRRGWVGVNPPGTFSPTDIPQIAAGEYWLPGIGVSGTSTISWAGRNGTNTLSIAAAQSPDASTGPGGNPDWTLVAANSDYFAQSSPASPLTATDGVYVACWVRHESLDTTNRVIVEQHGAAGARKWQLRKTASTTTLRLECSQDGTNLQSQEFTLTEPEAGGTVSLLDKYLFLEFVIDPDVASTVEEQTRLWVNLKAATSNGPSGSLLTALFNGGALRYGNNFSEAQDFNGRLGPLYIGRKVGGVLLPSDVNRRMLAGFLSPKDRRLNLVLDGNSLTAGQGSSGAATTYPAVLRAALGGLGYQTRDVHDSGHGGDTTQQLVDEFASGIAPFFDGLFARNVVVMFEVRNSTTNGQTAAQILASYQAYGAAARAAGFKFVAGTAPPTDGDAVGQGVAGAANALIRANWPSFADALVDLELRPEFTPAGNIANATYYSDGVHLTDAGYAVIAAAVQPVVLAL